MNKPIVGITMGDPAGIGPELIIRCFSEKKLPHTAVPLVIGSKEPLMDAMKACWLSIPLKIIRDIDELTDNDNSIQFIDVPLYHDFHNTGLMKENGAVSLQYIYRALEFIK